MQTLINYIKEKLIINKDFRSNDLHFIYDADWKLDSRRTGLITNTVTVFHAACKYLDDNGKQLKNLSELKRHLEDYSYVAAYSKDWGQCIIYHYEGGGVYNQLVIYRNIKGSSSGIYYEEELTEHFVHVLDRSSNININNPKYFLLSKDIFNEIKKAYDTVSKDIITEDLSDVKTKWHPKEGLFSGDNPKEIANYLLKNSKDEAQAMRRLCFYMNRAGDKLTNKTVLNKVKEILKSKKVDEKLVICPQRYDNVDEKLIINKDFEEFKYKPENISDLYKHLMGVFKKNGPGTRLNPIDLNYIDISNLDSLSILFKSIVENGHIIKYIDISKWDVHNITSFDSMFYDCNDLVSVGDLSEWKIKTNGYVSMQDMFGNCKNLIYIGDISRWDVSNVSNFKKMFCCCKKLNIENVGDLPNCWNISSDAYSFAMYSYSGIKVEL